MYRIFLTFFVYRILDFLYRKSMVCGVKKWAGRKKVFVMDLFW